ncbi:MAG TPA: hypothetical protein VHC72_16505 [Bryobacteraceae bacterium]|nr:hypothetical protein [Bryobacteraceae bacterium]
MLFLSLAEFVEVVVWLPLLVLELVLSVVELAPVLPGVCGVLAGPGGALCPHAAVLRQTPATGTSKNASLFFI